MIDFLKEALRDFEERAKNPLLATYLISFCAFNWKLVLILFDGGHSALWKIAVINKIGIRIWEPLIFAFAYVIVVHPIICLTVLIQSWPRAWHRKSLVVSESAIRDARIEADIASEERRMELLQLRQQNQGMDEEIIDQICEQFEVDFRTGSVLNTKGIRTRSELRAADSQTLTDLEEEIPAILSIAKKFGNENADQLWAEREHRNALKDHRRQAYQTLADEISTDLVTAMNLMESGIRSKDELRDLNSKRLESVAANVDSVWSLAAAVGNQEAKRFVCIRNGERFLPPDGAPFSIKVIRDIYEQSRNSTATVYGCHIAVTNKIDEVRTIYSVEAEVSDSNGRVIELFTGQEITKKVEPNGGDAEVKLKSNGTPPIEDVKLHSITIHTGQDNQPFRYEVVTPLPHE